jgi:HD domain-containing protein
MAHDTYHNLEHWFDLYVSRFFTDDPDYNAVITTKKDHTQRVCTETAGLCSALNLSRGPCRIAATAALFHDLGRFKQYQKYRTFSDRASENHAMLSVREIGRHRILSSFHTDEKRLITFAVAHHNAIRIPAGCGDRKLFYLKLLRDADKLDIWRLVSEYLQETVHNPEARKRQDITVHVSTAPGCSPAVINGFQEQRFVDFRDVKSFDDYKLLAIGWVYDLNFKPSFERVRKQRYIEKFAETLPQNGAIRSGVEKAISYVEGAIGKDSSAGYVPSAADLDR